MKLPSLLSFFLTICLITSASAFNDDTRSDARPAIRAIYHPVPTANQNGPDYTNPLYYPFRFYWETERNTPGCLQLLLPESASDYELAALNSPSSAPECAITIRGNELHWGASGGSRPAYACIYNYFLYPEWLKRIVNIHIPRDFPSVKSSSWLHPFIRFLERWLEQSIEGLHCAEYSKNYVYRGVTILPQPLAQELKRTWKECLETAVLDLPPDLFSSCDQSYCFYSTVPGLTATELCSSRRILPLKLKMFHIFRTLFDAASMKNLTPDTQHMLMELCEDARKIAGKMKHKKPMALPWQNFVTTFKPPYPEDGERYWEGKNAPRKGGKTAMAAAEEECSTLPLSGNPAWRDLFPNAPENVTGWMCIYPEGLCRGAFIHQGFLHTAITYLSVPFYRTHDFSWMKNPPSMNPYELWWDGDEMRVRRCFLKLEPAAERELKAYIRLICRHQAGKNHESIRCVSLFDKEKGYHDQLLQAPGENRDEGPDSYVPNFFIFDDACLYWETGEIDYLQEGSSRLEELRKDRRELERHMEKHPAAGEEDFLPAAERGAQKP